MNDKYLTISYECLSSIGNSFELESMMSEVVITFYQKTKALFVGFYERRDLSSPMIYAGKDIGYKAEFSQDKDECSLLQYSEFHIVVLPLKSSYMKFIYKKENNIEEIYSMVCNFQRKINFALSACAGVKELEKLNDELELRVEKSVEQIREHEKMLLIQSKSAIMGEMLEMVAHQWRQPLTAIGMISNNMLFSIILTESENEELDKKLFENELEDINKQVRYLSDTIDDFRNFFKESKSKQEFFIEEAIDKGVSLLRKQFEQSSIVIEIKNKCKRTLLYTYKNELMQVLLNILHNSKDAFEANDMKNKKIIIDCTKDDENLIIKIEDNAGGIPEDVISKMFEPYFSTKKEKNGTGLGLYMSKIIINRHLEGSIFAKNIDKGASFTIRIPIKIKKRGV
ncbi:MAG: HAMP domain-containing histidine kinase [Sulfurimonas sp.]|nr:HAMP domain-containing histidine kinase [Sulfurimonas sp.]